jgi:3-methyl-2-oxobutanoate hydroxymethyltransferase
MRVPHYPNDCEKIFMSRPKVTITELIARKLNGPKIAVVTAYDATMATLFDRGGADVLMVGDSLGMVIQGQDNTLGVTLDQMVYHCRAVTRARPSAHVVCDLPFLSYQVSPEDALRSAGRLVQEGAAESVKLEGGRSVTAAVAKIVAAGVPVMGHIGLTPQSVHRLGGFRVQGKTTEAASELVEDALALEDAGVYSLVVEGVPSEVAEFITARVRVPTIGIGAGPHTDGQVLVSYDLLGLYGAVSPKFVKRFRDLGQEATQAVSEYVASVQAGQFPGPEHSFKMVEGEALPQFEGSS